MVGNDIIDLKLAFTQSNWKRRGFLTKIFTEEEAGIILNSKNSFEKVWLFWSMKESAYKMYIQKHGYRFFAPKKFRCMLMSSRNGMVFIDDERYITTSKITNDYIFTEAILTNCISTTHCQFEFNSRSYLIQSERIYKELRTTVSRNLNVPIIEVQLNKNRLGIPKLYHKDVELAVSFSLTHHGKYGAYSIQNIV